MIRILIVEDAKLISNLIRISLICLQLRVGRLLKLLCSSGGTLMNRQSLPQQPGAGKAGWGLSALVPAEEASGFRGFAAQKLLRRALED